MAPGIPAPPLGGGMGPVAPNQAPNVGTCAADPLRWVAFLSPVSWFPLGSVVL